MERPCDVRSAVDSDKLSAGDKLGPDEAHDASAHNLQLQNMTSTMGKYSIFTFQTHTKKCFDKKKNI